ncbi:MAG: hypothetical protein H6Q06_565 [Acidobacteria bacterium]|nr:hypothetical protein [Acidobacteriota bacterium]
MKLKVHVMQRTVGPLTAALFFACTLLAAGEGREPDATAGTTKEEIALLKLQLAAQQQQIDQLRRELDEQKSVLRLAVREAVQAPENQVAARAVEEYRQPQVASLAPAIPLSGSGGAPVTTPPVVSQARSEPEKAAPMTFSIGSARISPVGFAEVVGYVRDANFGSGLGTNFAAIPYSTTAQGNLSEANLSAQQSRLGFRLDTRVPGMDLLAYVETDFLGTAAGNVAVTANGNSVRMRLFWFNLTRGKFEFLAGQSWSLLTPNRKGISPLPPGIFNTMVVDPNNHVGLVWTRSPQVRFVYHPNSTVTMAASLESPTQYAGGAGGAGVITFPSELASSYSVQLNTGSGIYGSPSPLPDFIGKLALDHTVGGRAFHLEFAGLLRRFAVFNPLTQVSYGAMGGGGSVNGNFEIVKNFRLFGSSFYSDGGGRYMYGLGPDLIARGDGSLSSVRAYSTLDGFEVVAHPRVTVYGYYGGAYFQKNTATDSVTGKPIGYGYSGSPTSHNRAIQQVTFGLSYLFWRKPEYGGLSLNTQYSYIFRNPWDPAPSQLGDAHANMLFLGFRYLLPGAAPSPK